MNTSRFLALSLALLICLSLLFASCANEKLPEDPSSEPISEVSSFEPDSGEEESSLSEEESSNRQEESSQNNQQESSSAKNEASSSRPVQNEVSSRPAEKPATKPGGSAAVDNEGHGIFFVIEKEDLPAKQSDEFYFSYVQQYDLGWNMKLLNKSNMLSADVDCELVDVGSGRLFDARASKALNQMISACRQAGNTIWAQSTHRTLAYQQKLMDNQIQKNLNLGYSREEAEYYSLLWVAPSGGSEHHLGLAVDFNEITEYFENTTTFAWLQENAARYGFILRYTEEDTEITGYGYEPWHYRYIGPDHAMQMKKLGIKTLEEYVYTVEYLLDKQNNA